MASVNLDDRHHQLDKSDNNCSFEFFCDPEANVSYDELGSVLDDSSINSDAVGSVLTDTTGNRNNTNKIQLTKTFSSPSPTRNTKNRKPLVRWSDENEQIIFQISPKVATTENSQKINVSDSERKREVVTHQSVDTNDNKLSFKSPEKEKKVSDNNRVNKSRERKPTVPSAPKLSTGRNGERKYSCVKGPKEEIKMVDKWKDRKLTIPNSPKLSTTAKYGERHYSTSSSSNEEVDMLAKDSLSESWSEERQLTSPSSPQLMTKKKYGMRNYSASPAPRRKPTMSEYKDKMIETGELRSLPISRSDSSERKLTVPKAPELKTREKYGDRCYSSVSESSPLRNKYNNSEYSTWTEDKAKLLAHGHLRENSPSTKPLKLTVPEPFILSTPSPQKKTTTGKTVTASQPLINNRDRSNSPFLTRNLKCPEELQSDSKNKPRSLPSYLRGRSYSPAIKTKSDVTTRANSVDDRMNSPGSFKARGVPDFSKPWTPNKNSASPSPKSIKLVTSPNQFRARRMPDFSKPFKPVITKSSEKIHKPVYLIVNSNHFKARDMPDFSKPFTPKTKVNEAVDVKGETEGDQIDDSKSVCEDDNIKCNATNLENDDDAEKTQDGENTSMDFENCDSNTDDDKFNENVQNAQDSCEEKIDDSVEEIQTELVDGQNDNITEDDIDSEANSPKVISTEAIPTEADAPETPNSIVSDNRNTNTLTVDFGTKSLQETEEDSLDHPVEATRTDYLINGQTGYSPHTGKTIACTKDPLILVVERLNKSLDKFKEYELRKQNSNVSTSMYREYSSEPTTPKNTNSEMIMGSSLLTSPNMRQRHGSEDFDMSSETNSFRGAWHQDPTSESLVVPDDNENEHPNRGKISVDSLTNPEPLSMSQEKALYQPSTADSTKFSDEQSTTTGIESLEVMDSLEVIPEPPENFESSSKIYAKASNYMVLFTHHPPDSFDNQKNQIMSCETEISELTKDVEDALVLKNNKSKKKKTSTVASFFDSQKFMYNFCCGPSTRDTSPTKNIYVPVKKSTKKR